MLSAWQFTRDELENRSPSRRDGIDKRKETYLRRTYCAFIQDAGMRLKVPQLTIATAVVFCHRFFARESMKRHEPLNVASTCLFLAGKVEETPKSLRDVIHVTWELKHRKDEATKEKIKHKPVYDHQREVILCNERLLLQTLGFDLNIQHSYKPLLQAVKKIATPESKNLAQAAWNFVNDSLRTTLCLQYDARGIAVAALYLAAKFLKVKLPSDGDKPWWQQFDVSISAIDDINNQILDLYENANGSSQPSGGKPTSSSAQPDRRPPPQTKPPHEAPSPATKPPQPSRPTSTHPTPSRDAPQSQPRIDDPHGRSSVAAAAERSDYKSSVVGNGIARAGSGAEEGEVVGDGVNFVGLSNDGHSGHLEKGKLPADGDDASIAQTHELNSSRSTSAVHADKVADGPTDHVGTSEEGNGAVGIKRQREDDALSSPNAKLVKLEES